MMKNSILIFLAVMFWSCGDDGGGGVTPMAVVPEISILSKSVNENPTTSELLVEVELSESTTEMVSVKVETIAKTAEAGVDFESLSTTIEIAPGQTKQTVAISILADDVKEIDETFSVLISGAVNATINFEMATILIRDFDEAIYTEEGYETAANQAGYNLVWSDEFDGETLDESSWTYEMGNGCNNDLCGWGNNELQSYSDQPQNIRLQNGELIITALEEPYSSARIITKDKREYKWGRIDIRAKLPKGQGIWPAIWMLGENIDDVSWPACGEIDIMELVGHTPNISHGTAHWGNAGEGSQFQGNSFSISQDFSDQYHVFTLLWKNNSMQWHVDETLFHTITTDNTQGFNYPFNNEFFFIMNVAIGGNWPGEPDETTVFPQRMVVDYIRVFQEN